MALNSLFPLFSALLLLAGCSVATDISYRADKREEYIRADGYALNCELDGVDHGAEIVLQTFTEATWGRFYTDWVHGKPSDRHLKITGAELVFPETSDTLVLREVRKERTYIFSAPDLQKKINRNKALELTLHLLDTDSGITTDTVYSLNRKKHRFLNGSFPHTL